MKFNSTEFIGGKLLVVNKIHAAIKWFYALDHRIACEYCPWNELSLASSVSPAGDTPACWM